jgi:hypothetical protein
MMQFSLRPALFALALACPGLAFSAEFRVEDVPSLSDRAMGSLKPGTITFSDHRSDELADGDVGLIRFEDWARERSFQKQLLSLYPDYREPTINVDVNGLTKRHKEKLHVYVAEARFVVDKVPGSVDLGRYMSLDFLQTIDPAIKHKRITADEAVPNRDPEFAYNKPPDGRWCEDPRSLCIQSRYDLEGKLPIGIRLANKLEDSGKKIADYLEFQSELRPLSEEETAQADLAKLTGLQTPVVGALEQNLFYVNQVIQSGKLLVVLQEHPEQAARTVATVFMTIAVESDVLERKKEYERVPVLRNLVPAQVLMGNSSFNTGRSISAGLPSYARNRIKALAAHLEGK